ncbi:MAG: phosphoribosylaminoimidazolesuccinocarboxamide synthase, partial [Acidithiobacillus ferrooxidans]
TAEEVEAMRRWTMRVNMLLSALFAKANLILVDFKLEFGRFDGELYLGDEFSPDGCRLWDARSLEKMDKDRFRRGLGGVVEAYAEVARRLGVPLPAAS